MSAPLRIALMASVRWYNAAAAYVVELGAALQQDGHQVRVWVQPGSPAEAQARDRGLPVAANLDLTAKNRLLRTVRALRGELLAFAPDVVNPHRGEDHLLAALALRGSAIPLVRTRGDVRTPRTHLGNRLIYRRATRSHIACADFMVDRFYPPLGVSPSRVHVVRPAVDADFAEGAPSREDARRRLDFVDGPWVGLIGRFTKAKGHVTLLRAFAAQNSKPAPRLLLAGTANDISEDELRAEATHAGVHDRVHLAGRYPDVRAALRALDVLVVPSIASEAIARVAMEALALGTPVIASRLNALTEVVGDAGLLVPPGDVGALSEALTRALSDPEWTAASQVAGPERMARRYNRREQIAKTIQVFQEAIASPKDLRQTR